MMLNTLRRVEFDALKEELAKIEMEKAELDVRLKNLSTSIAASKTRLSMLAPINILPDDVMVEVLLMAYQHRFPHCRFDRGLYYTNSPVAFAMVCRRWRHLALSMPGLWTCIHVTRHQGEQCEEMIKLYFERSKGRALSFFFMCHTEPVDEVEEFDVDWPGFEDTIWPRFRSTWALLLSQAHRWKNCALYSTHEEVAAHLARSLSGRILPRLESFSHLLYSEHYWRSRSVQFFAPNLARLQLMNVSARYPITDAFRRLTELKLSSGIRLEELTRILQLCSQTLASLTLTHMHLPDSFDEDAIPPSSISLPRLRFLALYDYSEHWPVSSPVLSRLLHGCPMLETLVAECTSVLAIEFLSGRIQKLATVKTLRCDESFYAIRHVSSTLIRPFPSLEELELFDVPQLEVFDIINAHDSPEVVAWPFLRSLLLHEYLHEDILLAVVKHLVDVGCPLRNVKVSAKTMRSLSLQSRQTLGGLYRIDLSCYEEDHYYEWSLDWHMDRDGPICSPWNGSIDFWDQF